MARHNLAFVCFPRYLNASHANSLLPSEISPHSSPCRMPCRPTTHLIRPNIAPVDSTSLRTAIVTLRGAKCLSALLIHPQCSGHRQRRFFLGRTRTNGTPVLQRCGRGVFALWCVEPVAFRHAGWRDANCNNFAAAYGRARRPSGSENVAHGFVRPVRSGKIVENREADGQIQVRSFPGTRVMCGAQDHTLV